MFFLWQIFCLTRSVLPGTKCWCLLSWGWRVDHGHKVGRPRSDLLADHHDVHTSQEEPVVVAVGPAHRVDARVPVQHVAVVADPVQVLENSQGRRSAATKRVACINTLQHHSVRPVGLWDCGTCGLLLGLLWSAYKEICSLCQWPLTNDHKSSSPGAKLTKLTSLLVKLWLLAEAIRRKRTTRTRGGFLDIVTRLGSHCGTNGTYNYTNGELDFCLRFQIWQLEEEGEVHLDLDIVSPHHVLINNCQLETTKIILSGDLAGLLSHAD